MSRGAGAAAFVKSHGLGNDYIVVDPADLPFRLTPESVGLICDRNLGVGSDGILAVNTPNGAEFGLRVYNPDGSEAEKSGNGIRIFAKFLRDHGYTNDDRFRIDTPGGRVEVELEWEGGRVTRVLAAMGRARFDDLERIDVDGTVLEVTSLSVGNPHCVVIVPDVDRVDVAHLGPMIEHHPAFPDRTNVQFAQVRSRREVQALIWERGAGYTLASGSSSCAIAAACHRRRLVDRIVTISMPGGRLAITVGKDGQLHMRGPVEEVFRGEFGPELVDRLVALDGHPVR
jgi:diaminopimelate epimerase